MPELPEVETIRQGLQKYIVGHKIVDIIIHDNNIFQGDKENIIGAKIKDVKRIGKGLIIELDNEYSLAIHIKLTGQLIYRGFETKNIKVSEGKVGVVPSKFTRIIFNLDNNSFLYYNDIRRFGWIKVLKIDDLKQLPFFKELGPEPPVVSNDGLTLDLFKSIIAKSKISIKPLLMDQKKIGGIGNIYANDALFDAEILPSRKANSLSSLEIKKLYNSILKVLRNGLKNGGASELTYVNALGQEGNYQIHFLVYGREGKKCLRCDGIIKKIKLGGRGTYFCNNCQA